MEEQKVPEATTAAQNGDILTAMEQNISATEIVFTRIAFDEDVEEKIRKKASVVAMRAGEILAHHKKNRINAMRGLFPKKAKAKKK